MKKDWEKRFDKEFVGQLGWLDKHIYRDGGKIHIKRVKRFIAKEKQKSYEEGIDKMKNLLALDGFKIGLDITKLKQKGKDENTD